MENNLPFLSVGKMLKVVEALATDIDADNIKNIKDAIGNVTNFIIVVFQICHTKRLCLSFIQIRHIAQQKRSVFPYKKFLCVMFALINSMVFN